VSDAPVGWTASSTPRWLLALSVIPDTAALLGDAVALRRNDKDAVLRARRGRLGGCEICDPVGPIFITAQATGRNYIPG
jgi:hypothetical protein